MRIVTLGWQCNHSNLTCGILSQSLLSLTWTSTVADRLPLATLTEWPRRRQHKSSLSVVQATQVWKAVGSTVNSHNLILCLKACVCSHASATHAGACPVKNDTNAPTGEEGKNARDSECPINPRNVMPLQPAAVPAQDSDSHLSTCRASSTIPVAEPESLPDHQKVAQSADGDSNWLYPSEKMFYDAMKRKVCIRAPLS